MNDGLDLGRDRGCDVDLRLDEKKKRNHKQRHGPNAGLLAMIRARGAGIDGGEDCSVTDASEGGHEHHLPQRGAHVAGNELEE